MLRRVRQAFCLTLLGAALFAPAHGLAQVSALDRDYREIAGRLIGAAMVDTAGHDKLAFLTTRIGHRLSGSSALERAIAWIEQQMKTDGLENVRTQPVKVPYWVRGSESADVVQPVQRPLNMIG